MINSISNIPGSNEPMKPKLPLNNHRDATVGTPFQNTIIKQLNQCANIFMEKGNDAGKAYIEQTIIPALSDISDEGSIDCLKTLLSSGNFSADAINTAFESVWENLGGVS